jgi:hypothetical protein
MRKTWLTGLILLACCGDDKLASPQTRIADKLRACDVIDEGEFSVSFEGEADRCELRCFEAAGCGELRLAFCAGDLEREGNYGACLERCGAGLPFACADGSNDEALSCDAFDDCADGSDEKSCADDAFFECDGEGHVPFEFKCDGESDCFDDSDEKGCAADAFFTCDNGDSIPKSWRCDAEDDCEDGGDEQDCPADAFFVCDGGDKVPAAWVCDGVPDCRSDDSDEEQDCAELQCGPAD